MEVITKKLNELKPYEKNPRRNDESVELVANSIKEFGFKVPLVIDKDNVIVCGHTRYKASKKLGLKEVPCVVADDLTEEQIKAYRLADNKVSEASMWDDDLLKLELDDIATLDMTDFGFDFDFFAGMETEEDDEGYYGDERERTMNTYNLDDYDERRAEGFYQMPTLERIDYIPEDLIGFNYVLSSNKYDKCVHFFVDDYQFERIWNDPHNYIYNLKQFDATLTPDFSLYMDMPMAMKIWNVYRSRLIGQICQDAGMRVIPTLSWAEKETFKFCFDGIPKNSTVAVSTIGVKRDKEATKIWIAGMDEAIKKLQPKNILVYGGDIGYDFGNINVKYYNNSVTERMKESKND